MSTIDDLKSELDQRPAGKFCPAFFKRRGRIKRKQAKDIYIIIIFLHIPLGKPGPAEGREGVRSGMGLWLRKR